MIEKIDAGTAIRLLDAGKAVAVDVREPDEYAVGHIPGAKLLPLGEVNSRAAEVLPEKEATWLVYCRTGRRSAEAVQKLDALGYSNLYDLGGILSWPYEIEGDFEGHFKIIRRKRNEVGQHGIQGKSVRGQPLRLPLPAGLPPHSGPGRQKRVRHAGGHQVLL